jgi:hypothetical protein
MYGSVNTDAIEVLSPRTKRFVSRDSRASPRLQTQLATVRRAFFGGGP